MALLDGTMTCVVQADGVPAQSAHFAGDAPTGRERGGDPAQGLADCSEGSAG